MALKELKDTTLEIPDELKDAIDTEVEYNKLYLFRIIARIGAGFMHIFVFGLLLLLVLFFLSIGLAMAIGKLLGSYWVGFFAMAGTLTLFTGVLYAFRKKIINKRVIRAMSDIFYVKKTGSQ